MRRDGFAFTLIELLVVIAIIAVLVAILAPSAANIADRGRQLICMSQLRQIHIAFVHYQGDNDRCAHRAPNYGLWERPPDDSSYWWFANPADIRAMAPGTQLPANHWSAYWGIAYEPYADGSRETFRCPSAQATDCDPAYSDWQYQKWVAYGLNRYISGARSTVIKVPSETIICHDAYEHLLEGINWGTTDALSAWGIGLNITQWRNCRRGSCIYANKHHEVEYYRHLDTCPTLWYEGHVTAIPESDGTNIPLQWYTGP